MFFFCHFSAISEEEKSFMKQNLILSFDEPVNQVILKSMVKNIQIASDLPWHTFIYCRKYSSIVIQTPENKILHVFPYLGQFLLFGSNREQKKNHSCFA